MSMGCRNLARSEDYCFDENFSSRHVGKSPGHQRGLFCHLRVCAAWREQYDDQQWKQRPRQCQDLVHVSAPDNLITILPRLCGAPPRIPRAARGSSRESTVPTSVTRFELSKSSAIVFSRAVVTST